jgi:hypothetical protein
MNAIALLGAAAYGTTKALDAALDDEQDDEAIRKAEYAKLSEQAAAVRGEK